MRIRVVPVPGVRLNDLFFSSAIYIAGIMFFEYGLELFNSITTLATDRFKSANTFTKCP